MKVNRDKANEKEEPKDLNTTSKRLKGNISLSHYRRIEFLETQKTFSNIENAAGIDEQNIDETVVTIHPSKEFEDVIKKETCIEPDSIMLVTKVDLLRDSLDENILGSHGFESKLA